MKSGDVLFLAIIVMLHGAATAPTLSQGVVAGFVCVVLCKFGRDVGGHWG